MKFLIPSFSNDGEIIHNRSGGFKKFLFSQLLGEMIHFDEHIFANGFKSPTR